MTNILLLLSLIMNAAAIFAIIILYLRQNRLVEAEKKQGKIIKEIEEVFTSYLLELKDENENFIKMFEKMSSPQKEDGESALEARTEPSDLDGEKEGLELSSRGNKGISYHAAKKAYSKNNIPSSTEKTAEEEVAGNDPKAAIGTSEPSLLEQVLTLKMQGKTIEETARILNKGKTEIELLLKFRRNKQ